MRSVKKTLLLATIVLVTIALLGACSKNIQNEEAVKTGVLDYLQARSAETGLNMAAMDVSVSSLAFEKDTARANVSFHPKGMPGGGGMSRQYVLDRKGDKWIVNKAQSGAVTMSNPDGSSQPLPGGALPPGHPPAGATGGELPPGHPPAPAQK
jgi:hypothetical protein